MIQRIVRPVLATSLLAMGLMAPFVPAHADLPGQTSGVVSCSGKTTYGGWISGVVASGTEAWYMYDFANGVNVLATDIVGDPNAAWGPSADARWVTRRQQLTGAYPNRYHMKFLNTGTTGRYYAMYTYCV